MVRRFRFKNLAYLIFAIVYYFTASITPVFAIPKFPTGRDAEFIENNILFYNPDGKKNSSCLSPDRSCQTSDGSDVSVVGDGFLGMNLNPNFLNSKPQIQIFPPLVIYLLMILLVTSIQKLIKKICLLVLVQKTDKPSRKNRSTR